MTLELHKQALDDIYEHVEQLYPEESCGFIFGRDGDVRAVTRIQRVGNAQTENRGRRFRIAPGDYRKAEKLALANDLNLLGVYHSHPDHPAEPSEHDRKVAMPYFSYIIVSVRSGHAEEIRSWRLNENHTFDEETVEIVRQEPENI